MVIQIEIGVEGSAQANRTAPHNELASDELASS